MQTKGGVQPTLCLKVTRVGYWLATIQTNSIKNERYREIIEGLQDEFADVAHEIFMRHAGVEATALTPLPDDPQVQALAAQYNDLLGVVNLMREHLVDVSATVSPLPEKLDQIVTLLQEFFATQQLQETQIARIDERTQRLTPAHARAVQELINEMVFRTRHATTPLDYYKLYGSLKHQFRVASYKEIPDGRFEEVMAFLREELRKVTGGSTPEQGSLF
jgi:hypothetical protein